MQVRSSTMSKAEHKKKGHHKGGDKGSSVFDSFLTGPSTLKATSITSISEWEKAGDAGVEGDDVSTCLPFICVHRER